MAPSDGNQGDVILVAEETPSKLPGTEPQALETVGGTCHLEPSQPGSVWSLWDGLRWAPWGSEVTNNVSRSLQQGCAL